ncbi:nucleoside-diphosphate sugar epimerase [Paenibacillus sp. D2_2]|uniref:nucleoside-diphosphate sugar epimerase n=1 Tax=Paenibacillus sp. D2_2 TaxID=3073092 RepID=UPI0028162C35|nr:nucleoside-diphosphate sugar epimerase [Paenibacillus sp. D2_2]WMT40199.1 nucleoside-diphosphate sugar epimerase [Paenibacillus sp. D2_2]
MEEKITEIIVHMSHSHQQMARVMDAERQVVVRMSQIVHAIPDVLPEFDGVPGLIANTGRVNKSVISYLNVIADLQEAMAENLGLVLKEMRSQDEE